MAPSSRPTGRILPALLLAALVLGFYVPLLPWWSVTTVGPPDGLHVDASLHLWQYGWLRNVLEQGGPAFRATGLTFPAAVDLLGLWEGHLDLLVAAPLVTWAGPYAAANLASLVHLAILAGGVFALARGVSGSAAAAAAAAALAVLSPAVGHEFGEGRVEAGCLGFVALALLWAGRWWTGGRPVHLAGFVLALALALVGYLHSGPMLVLLLPCLALGYLVAGRRAPDGSPAPWTRPRTFAFRGLLWLAALGALAAGALAFARLHVSAEGLPSFSASLMKDPAYHGWFDQSRGGGLPLRDLLLPLPLARQAGSGIVLPLVALLALAAPGRAARSLPWWLGALLLHVLAMGTVLSLAGEESRVGSPYAYLPVVLPFLLRFQWPQRFLLLADVCLAVLAAIGLAAAGDRVARWRRAGSLPVRALPVALPFVAVGAGLLQGGASWPYPVAPPPALPSIVSLVARDRPEGVLEVQVGGREAERASWQQFQYDRFLAALVHRAPMCCLELPRRLAPLSLDRMVARTPLMAWMLYGYRMPDLGIGGGVTPEAWGYTHLVIHGHGCSEDIRSLESVGWTPRWLPVIEDPSGERLSEKRTQGRATQPVEDRTCDEVLALLSDTYGPPAAREPAGDGTVVLWRLPRSPLLAEVDPALAELSTPSLHPSPPPKREVLRPR